MISVIGFMITENIFLLSLFSNWLNSESREGKRCKIIQDKQVDNWELAVAS